MVAPGSEPRAPRPQQEASPPQALAGPTSRGTSFPPHRFPLSVSGGGGRQGPKTTGNEGLPYSSRILAIFQERMSEEKDTGVL